MSVIDKLNQMHRDAVEQIRAGQDNEFLVGFLTTSTMLELSNLIVNDFDLEQYAQAVVDVITQYAPIDRCRVQLDLRGFSTVVAASGALPKRALPAGMEPGHSTIGILRVDGVTSGTLIAEDVPAPLIAADFLQVAADQVASGLGKITERENEIRRRAVQRVIDLIDALDERWGPDELDAITRTLVSLPTVSGATISAFVDRLPMRPPPSASSASTTGSTSPSPCTTRSSPGARSTANSTRSWPHWPPVCRGSSRASGSPSKPRPTS
jgi:hypothetical protein